MAQSLILWKGFNMPRQKPKKPRQKRYVYLFSCEDKKSSRFYLEELGREYGINVQTVTSSRKSPQKIREALLRKVKEYAPEDIKVACCLFDKDDLGSNFKTEVEETKKTTYYKRKKCSVAASAPCYEYWLLLHILKTDKDFENSQKCCEDFKTAYNKKFEKDFSIEELKAKQDIFTALGGKEALKVAIDNAKSYHYTLSQTPYTDIHKIIEEILLKEKKGL